MSTPESTTPLSRLLEAMHAAKIDFWLQGVADEFQGEYTPACAQRLNFLTGFTGSAGLGVFRADGKPHTLFVDGRYTLQAANEVDSQVISVLNSGDVTLGEWLKKEAKGNVVIGFDPWLATEQQLKQWKKLTQSQDIKWHPISPNLVDGIWQDRPAPPAGDVRLQPLALAGKDYANKRDALLSAMEKEGAEALVLTQPDSINWLLNIRGDDIPYNPLLLCYFILQKNAATLHSYERPFNKEISDYFQFNKVGLGRISDVFSGVSPDLPAKTKIMLDPSFAAHGWWQMATACKWEIIEADDPTQLAKACKNADELAAIKSAHQRDGASLSRFLHWFDRRAGSGNYPDELEVATKLEEFRARDNGYRGPSFATIAGAGPHGAIVHYHASGKTNRRAAAGEIFLLDSGGQYEGGTTDVTRTIFVVPPNAAKSAPTREMKDHVTRVLKGHIALATAKFPEGTSGVQLDALARQYLWAAGLDYDHGTGHGVGAALCVHEGPQRISKKGSAVPLVPGMILSNEPGFYLEGAYGIRIESLVTVVKLGDAANGKALLGFETLTLAPIDTRLVEVSMLTNDERNWLNDYHQRVYKTHVNQLDETERKWLAEATRAI